jgi:hypothetical protein
MAVVDGGREEPMLDGIEPVAVAEGLDPQVARQVRR